MTAVVLLALVITVIYVCKVRKSETLCAYQDERTDACVTQVLQKFDELIQSRKLLRRPDLNHSTLEVGQVLRRKLRPADLVMLPEQRGSIVNHLRRFTGIHVCSGTMWFIVLDSGKVRPLLPEMVAPIFHAGLPSSIRVCVGRPLVERLGEEVAELRMRLSEISFVVLATYFVRIDDRHSHATWSVDLAVIEGIEDELSAPKYATDGMPQVSL